MKIRKRWRSFCVTGSQMTGNNDRNIKGIADAIPLSAINSEIIDFARKEERTLPAV